MNSVTGSSFITLAGAIGFVGILVYLHIVQDGYSPVHQLMSELALGEQGQLMLGAFMMFALSVAGAIGVMSSFKADSFIRVLLGLASTCLVGAGVFKLGVATTLHVVLVAVAFVLIGLVMFLLPQYVTRFKNLPGKVISWGLCAGTALAVSLGNNTLPIGIGQRIATACILLWLCWLAISALRQKGIDQ